MLRQLKPFTARPRASASSVARPAYAPCAHATHVPDACQIASRLSSGGQESSNALAVLLSRFVLSLALLLLALLLLALLLALPELLGGDRPLVLRLRVIPA